MKKTIHYALVLDQSGSMQHLKKEIISSFNEQVEMIRKLQKNEPEVEIKITLCIFNDDVIFKYIAQNIVELKKLTSTDYQPNSCTALYDAIGTTIFKVDEIQQTGEHVFLAIFTDGLENASKEYTSKDIQLQLDKVEEEGWEIKFFCRYEDNIQYKRDLGLSNDVQFSLSLNVDGLGVFEEQVMYKLKQMINPKSKIKH
jgi:hypothetical protein